MPARGRRQCAASRNRSRIRDLSLTGSWLRGPSAGPTAAGSTSAPAGCAGRQRPWTHRCPVFEPIIRSTMTTCRARQAAASSSCRISASAIAQTSPYVARSWATRRSDAVRTVVALDVQPAGGQQPGERLPERRLVQPPSQARLLGLGEALEAPEEALVLGAGDELQLAELHRLEAARRRQALAELEEVLRRHRLQHVDLLHEHPLDDVHAVHQVPGPPQPVSARRSGPRRSVAQSRATRRGPPPPRAAAAGTRARRPGGW